MFSKKKKAASPALLAELQKKHVLSWDTHDTANWIKAIGFSQYSSKFLHNKISGAELVTLTSLDLKAVGVKAVGHQKAILTKIQDIQSGVTDAPSASIHDSDKGKSELSHDMVSSMDDSISSSATGAANRIELIVSFNGARRTVYVKKTYNLERIQSKFEDLFSYRMVLKHGGKEVTTDDEWRDLVNATSAGDPIELIVEREDPNTIHPQERAMLQGLLDAVFVIDTQGIILFANLAAEEMLGFSSAELVGKNVSCIAPPEVRSKHDHFLRRYLETGNAKVIGEGRPVQAIHKDGHEISCWLSVSEQKKMTGRHTFMGSLHQIQARETTEQTEKFAVLDGVQEAVIVINSEGLVQFVNVHMEELLGYGNDLLGRNVSCIMPEPYASSHHQFVLNYLKSGTPKVIGKGARIVVAKRANGSVLPVRLEVDEVVLDNHRYFVAGMVPKDSTQKKAVSFLEKTRMVVDSLALPAIVISGDGSIQAFNKQASSAFGYTAEEVISQNVSMLMNEADAKMHDTYLKRYLETGEGKIIGKFRHVTGKSKQGKPLEFKMSVSKAMDPDDHAVYFTGTFTIM